MKLLWLTDLHIDFLSESHVRYWAAHGPGRLDFDRIVITGDTSVGPCLVEHLRLLKSCLLKPISFVCGNHDMWESSWNRLHQELRDENLIKDGIVWMGAPDFIQLTDTTALVGHDGWYDGVHGKSIRSRFVMNDWFKIDEYKGGADLLAVSKSFAAEGAKHIEQGCEAAISNGAKRIVVLTHFPPFPEVCRYRGRPSEPDALPWYCSAASGETLTSLAERHRDVDFTVLCGHTHSAADRRFSANLRVIVGEAEYGDPRFNIIEVI